MIAFQGFYIDVNADQFFDRWMFVYHAYSKKFKQIILYVRFPSINTQYFETKHSGIVNYLFDTIYIYIIRPIGDEANFSGSYRDLYFFYGESVFSNN